MKLLITIIQITSAVLLCIFILVQGRGAGLSATFGGTDTFYSTKRGAEKVLAIATIVLAVIFLLSSFLTNFVR